MSVGTAALLTDYGPGSEYVGALHAVLASGAPGAERVDLAHDIPPGDVRWGAIVLERTTRLVPGAVVVAVVDPGVGTTRRGVVVATDDGGALVGPDNGLLALAADARGVRQVVQLEPPWGAPPTFHGRDVFAPAAVRLLGGSEPAELGAAADPGTLVRPELPAPIVVPGQITTRVAGIDRFGNVALHGAAADLGSAGIAPGDDVRVVPPSGERPGRVGRTFGEIAPGGVLVYVDSHGMLTIAVTNGSAASALALEADLPVVIRAARHPAER